MILRIPPSLHQRLKGEARAADVSLNTHCRALLSRRTRSALAPGTARSMALAGGPSRPTAALQDLAARVLEAWAGDIEGLVLFGSYARGRETAVSDIDVLVALGRNVTLDRDTYARWHPQEFDGHEVAPLLAQVPDDGGRIGGLWFEAALDGIVLFDRDLRLSRFLARVRDLVASGRVKRMTTHGHPYWVHCDPSGPGSAVAVE